MEHGPAKLSHRDGTSHQATPGMTEVYFGPDDGCPVAHVQRPDRGEIGARIVACVNACEGMDDPEAEITRLQTIVDVLEGEDPIPRRLWEIRQSWPTSTLNFRGRRPEETDAEALREEVEYLRGALEEMRAGAVALVQAVFNNGDSVPLAQDLAWVLWPKDS